MFIEYLRSFCLREEKIEFCKKIIFRSLDYLGHSFGLFRPSAEYRRWLESHCVTADQLFSILNLSIDQRIKIDDICNAARAEAQCLPEFVDEAYQGGACIRALSALVLAFRPGRVFETGVALGFSSRVILDVLDILPCGGELISSDLPYFGIKNSINNCGSLALNKDRPNWRLLKSGDTAALSLLIEERIDVDFLHYDSDKSFYGRKLFFRSLHRNLGFPSVIMIDDIQNDNFFYVFVKNYNIKKFFTLKHKGSVVAGIAFV